MDLHLEHQNNFLKASQRPWKNAVRVSKDVNKLNTIVQNFEKKNGNKKETIQNISYLTKTNKLNDDL